MNTGVENVIRRLKLDGCALDAGGIIRIRPGEKRRGNILDASILSSLHPFTFLAQQIL